MVCLDWGYGSFRMMTRKEKFERDLRLLRCALWMMPLLAVKEMERITEIDENRCYQLLGELIERSLVTRTTIGRAGGKRYRYWLTSKGVDLVAKETRSTITWQVTERGVGWLMRRLPMVEAFYALVPGLLAHDGVRIGSRVMVVDESGEELQWIDFTPDLMVFEFHWMQSGEIHAVVRYENGAWFCLVWVGSMVTEHMLREKARLAGDQLDGKFQACGWIILGFDDLAARLATEFWTGHDVLAMSSDGHVVREMRPGIFTWSFLGEEAIPARLGRPENLVNWLDKKSNQYKVEMEVLNEPLNYAMFRFIGEWYGPTPAHLRKRFGESYRAAVRALQRAGLVAKLDGGFYLTVPGDRTAAQMDRVSPKSVRNRMQSYLHEDGAYRRQQQRHNCALLDVYQKLRDQGVDAYGGWRTRRTAHDGVQVVPDATVLLRRPYDPSVILFLELEFTATTAAAIEDKRRPYLSVEWNRGKPIPIGQLWVFETSQAEEAYRRTRGSELALTVVLDEFLESSSWSTHETWQIDQDRVPINDLVYMLDEDYIHPWELQ